MCKWRSYLGPYIRIYSKCHLQGFKWNTVLGKKQQESKVVIWGENNVDSSSQTKIQYLNMGVSIHEGTTKWMCYEENTIKMYDSGVALI